MLTRFRLACAMVALGLLAVTPLAQATPLVSLSEGFDNVGALSGAGWAFANNSTPGGTTDWFQGIDAVFAAHSGASDSYIAANFNAAASGGDISLWLITPELTFGTGSSTASMWVRTEDPAFSDGLQFRLSTAGASTDVGSTTTSLGVFTTGISILLTGDWALQTVFINNPGAPISGRLAFRYVVTDTSVNGDYIGIDDFSYQSAVTEPVPEPGTVLLMATGGLALLRRRNRR